MENTQVVNTQVTNETQAVTPTVEIPVTVEPTQAPGSKTDPALLLQSLQEERIKRQELEAKLKEYESQTISSEDVFSDEGRALKNQIEDLTSKIDSLQEENELKSLVGKYPVLDGLQSEFKVFKADYPRHKTENVLKIFLTEKGLLETTERKGLETPSGGTKTVPTSGISAEQAGELRKNNYNKYMELLKSGAIKPEDIK